MIINITLKYSVIVYFLKCKSFFFFWVSFIVDKFIYLYFTCINLLFFLYLSRVPIFFSLAVDLLIMSRSAVRKLSRHTSWNAVTEYVLPHLMLHWLHMPWAMLWKGTLNISRFKKCVMRWKSLGTSDLELPRNRLFWP